MEKQTATEWLFERIWVTPKDRLDWNALLIKAKEMEKEQIINAYETAMETDIYNEPLKVGKQYYNETYKQD
jgi:hypothetical protein